MENKIVLYGYQEIECLLYSSSPLTSAQADEFNNPENLSKNLEWENYPNAKIICNFNDNLVSSLMEDITTDNITGYEISKKTTGENFFTKVANISTQELEDSELSTEAGYYKLIDYNVKNNNQYQYQVIPLTENYAQAQLTETIIAKWDIFTLTPIQHIADTRYAIVRDESDEPIIWSFQMNCSEGDISLNRDITTFNTFTSKPKVSIGETNYHKGQLSCLLGNMLYNDTYYESGYMLDKWNQTIQNNHLFLFKNAKGDAMIVTLEDGIKRKYMNEAMNYYINTLDDGEVVTTRPTTITFSYIEVLDAKDIQIYR